MIRNWKCNTTYSNWSRWTTFKIYNDTVRIPSCFQSFLPRWRISPRWIMPSLLWWRSNQRWRGLSQPFLQMQNTEEWKV